MFSLECGSAVNFLSYSNVFPTLINESLITYKTEIIGRELDDYSGTAISSLDLPTSFDLSLWTQDFRLTILGRYDIPESPSFREYLIRSTVDTISLLEVVEIGVGGETGTIRTDAHVDFSSARLEKWGFAGGISIVSGNIL